MKAIAGQASARRIRFWPAVLAVLAYPTIALLVSHFGAESLRDPFGTMLAPLGSALFLLLWWLFASRASFGERILGALLFVLPLIWLAYFHRPFGYAVVMRAMPVMTAAVVAVLLVTVPLRWTRRRWVAAATLLICAAAFTSVRFGGMPGDSNPDLSWRWTPASEGHADGMGDAASMPNRIASLPDQADSGDWPRFRGPGGDSRVSGTTFSTDWSTEPRELWRHPVGLGWASFAAVGDYLFTQEQRGSQECVVCYEAATGDQVWAIGEPVEFEDPMGSGPRATPSFAGGMLYTLGVTGIVRCLDATSGETKWKRDLRKDTGADVPQWGFASSPLVKDGLMLLYSGAGAGRSVVAYDSGTGALAWTGGTGTHGYSSVAHVSIDDTPQFLILDDFAIQSLAPETGALLWEHLWQVEQNPRISQPVLLDGNAVYIGTADARGTRKLRLAKEGDAWRVTEEWTVRHFRPYFSDFVHHEGYFYGYDRDRLTCIDAGNGDERWSGDRVGGQVLLLPDMDMLLILTEKGKVQLVPATPDGFSVVAQFQAIEGKTWNHPVIANGRLYVRNSEESACFMLPQ